MSVELRAPRSDDSWRGKEIHYRMHPQNIGCLTAARSDCCCLANNHILDWGYDGLAETLRTLDAAGIAHAGAGGDAAEAAAPAVLDVRGKGSPESQHSASHGAGRVMSRTNAMQTFT
jgi:poly-gamma-glutamate capsule biosynthesis protein CapA/YwtB (metallophosphatase superfamily)